MRRTQGTENGMGEIRSARGNRDKGGIKEEIEREKKTRERMRGKEGYIEIGEKENREMGKEVREEGQRDGEGRERKRKSRTMER